MTDGRFCAGCRRHLPADSFAGGRLCRRCHKLRSLLWVADDLDAKGYPFVGVVRQAAQLLARIDQGDAEAGCAQCGGDLPSNTTGRPAIYCTSQCRKRAWRARNRDESRHWVA